MFRRWDCVEIAAGLLDSVNTLPVNEDNDAALNVLQPRQGRKGECP